MRPGTFSDRITILLLILLLASVSAFFSGLFPYPFGLLVLLVMLVARILHLRGSP